MFFEKAFTELRLRSANLPITKASSALRSMSDLEVLPKKEWTVISKINSSRH